MKTINEAIATLKLSEKSCRDEASGELDDSHSLTEGMDAIEANLKEAHRFISTLARRKPVFLTARQRSALKDLAGKAERDDLIAALEVE